MNRCQINFKLSKLSINIPIKHYFAEINKEPTHSMLDRN